MSLPGNIKFTFNANPVLDKLLLMKASLRRGAGKDAMKYALDPMLQEAKARVPKDTGALRRGIISQVRVYASGLRIVGLIGPSRSTFKLAPGKTWAWAGPMSVSRYAHMIENGYKNPRGFNQPPSNAPPQPFLRPALDHNLHKFRRDFGQRLVNNILAISP